MTHALVSTVSQQLKSFVLEEVKLVLGTPQEVEKFTSTLESIQAVLTDAEEEQVKKETVKLWLEKLKDVLYDMEDVLDEWSTEIRRSEIEGVGLLEKVCSYLFSLCNWNWNCFSQVSLRRRIGHKIKEIRDKLDDIAKEKDQFQFIDSGMRTTTTIAEPPTFRMTSSLIDELDVCGRDQDKDIILSKLLSESSRLETSNVPTVISICGPGGYGKTTLAQMVFNDDKVNNHFKERMWVCVSDPFDLTRLAKAIIKAAGGQNVSSNIEWQDLHQELCRSVTGKRFLLVLDDVWTEKHTDWSPLKLAFKASAQGSRIVVTTRSTKVASMVDSAYIHDLGKLSEEKCLELFKRIAFRGWTKEEREKVEDIGVDIVEKCKGVPLFVKALGGLMFFKKTRSEWEQVLENDAWELQDVEKEVLPVLLLSYYALPSDVKRCFMYCAVFPKDHQIGKDELIKLWMAQGLLNSTGRRDLEVVGTEYFNELLMRSFFQNMERDDNGNIIYCKMHDLIHDFAQFLTKTECFIADVNNTEFNNNSKKVRHLNDTRFTDLSSILPSICEAKNLRTLIIAGQHSWLSHSIPAPSNLFCQLTCLRELSLRNHPVEELPNEVEKLIHLRYFDLSETRLKELPETMCRLYNLQTLKLNRCSSLCKLPQGIEKMINLRHLEIERTNKLSYLPQGIGRLSSLRTLCKFIVGDVRGGGCKIGELKNLNHLQGYLKIFELERVADVNEANEAQLKNKQHLRGLGLSFKVCDLENVGEREIERIEGLLEGLQPHRNLVELRINGYPGSKFPNWMANSLLSNLQKLIIKNLGEVKLMGQVFGRIAGSDGVVTIPPRLKELYIGGMDNLEEWDLRVEDGVIMPFLSKLTLEKFPKFQVLPALGNLPVLESLVIKKMNSVKRVGVEFLGINVDVDDDGTKRGGGESRVVVAFPQLKEFTLDGMNELEEWDLRVEDGVIMPCLRKLTLSRFPKFQVLPALGNLPVLETLDIVEMTSVKRIGFEFFGINVDVDDDGTKRGGGESIVVVPFPQLKKLHIRGMDNLEEWEMLTREEEEEHAAGSRGGRDIIIPLLLALSIRYCPKLKELPPYIFPASLRELIISACPKLSWTPCLPPLLEELTLNGDVGVLSRSLPTNQVNNSNNNLKSLSIHFSRHSSLPEGLAHLTSLQRLSIGRSNSLMCMSEELKQLTSLQHLEIEYCSVLGARCQKEVGEDWSIISHIPNININGRDVRGE